MVFKMYLRFILFISLMVETTTTLTQPTKTTARDPKIPQSFCEIGYDWNPANNKCEDIDECSKDPAFLETHAKYEEAMAKGETLGNWKTWFVKPKIPGSAYAICYDRAAANNSKNYWFTSRSSELPLCVNTVYNPAGAYDGSKFVKSWQGFECGCEPGKLVEKEKTKFTYVLTCPAAPKIDCLLGKGLIYDNTSRQCYCDRSNGYEPDHVNEVSKVDSEGRLICKKRECTDGIILKVKNTSMKIPVICDYTTSSLIAVSGYVFEKDPVTEAVVGLIDINECEDENICCNRKKAQCDTHGGLNKCSVKCINQPGNYICKCDERKLRYTVDKDTCQCVDICNVQSAWYLKCAGDEVKCSNELWKKLSEAPTAPTGPVCSRFFDNNGFKTYPSIMALVSDMCNKRLFCAFPPNEIHDIRELPAFNYEGQCIQVENEMSNVKCPFGDTPQYFKFFKPYAFCPFKNYLTGFPPLDPKKPNVKSSSEHLSCGGQQPGSNTLFLFEKPYLENV